MKRAGGGQQRGEVVGRHGFLVAPKRTRGAKKAMLERPMAEPDLDAGAGVDEVAAKSQSDEEGASPHPMSAPPVNWCPRARRGGELSSAEAGVDGETAKAEAGASNALAISVPAWARFPRAADRRRTASSNGRKATLVEGDDDDDDWDAWAAPAGADFEQIVIGFKEGDELEDEASTCDEDLNDEDFEDVFSAAEVVIGYRADVAEGDGFPDDVPEVLPEAEGDSSASANDDQDGEGRALDAEGDVIVVDSESANGDGRDAAQRWANGDVTAPIGIRPEPKPKVSQIIFVVHGMGATQEGLKRNAQELKESLLEVKHHWFWHTSVEVHVEMIDWKSAICDTQDSIFDKITPAEARATRMSLNSTISDAIFYKTPHHRAKIIDTVTSKMNTRYAALLGDSAGRFADARVSIVGHSLGSVISYDVLTGFSGEKAGECQLIEFEVDHFFLWGSPLAAFVSIADIEHQSGKFTLPAALRVTNIFHPQDPVAFRLEPLYYHDQEQIPPEMIPYWVNNGFRSNKQWARSYEYAKGVAHQKWMSLKSSVCDMMGTSIEGDRTRAEWESYLNSEHDVPALGAGSSADGLGDPSEDGAEALPRHMRIDYALQEGAGESLVESLGLLQSHFCYWTSRDVALLMLKKICCHGVADMNADERAEQEAADQAAREKEEHERQLVASGDAPSGLERLVALQSIFGNDDLVRAMSAVPCVNRDRGNDDDEPRHHPTAALMPPPRG